MQHVTKLNMSKSDAQRQYRIRQLNFAYLLPCELCHGFLPHAPHFIQPISAPCPRIQFTFMIKHAG